jgi:hypothetical protein
MVNTNETVVEVPEPTVNLEEVDFGWKNSDSIGFESLDREMNIQSQLRLDHLNSEERKSLMGACSEFADVFYLPGDKLTF